MMFHARQSILTATLALAIGMAAGSGVQAQTTAAGLPEVIRLEFTTALRGANAAESLTAFRSGIVSHPRFAGGLAALFVSGRSKLAASIGATAMSALIQARLPRTDKAAQAKAVARVLGLANPKAVVEILFAMSITAPTFRSAVLAGLSAAAPLQVAALRQAYRNFGPAAATTDTISGGSTELPTFRNELQITGDQLINDTGSISPP